MHFLLDKDILCSLIRIIQNHTASEIEPTRLSLTHLLEEEHCPTYKAELYYPMRLGEILNNKYQVCMKFGWGTTATVWVARDLDQ